MVYRKVLAYPSESIMAAPGVKQHFGKFYKLLRTTPFCLDRGVTSSDVKKRKGTFLGQMSRQKDAFNGWKNERTDEAALGV